MSDNVCARDVMLTTFECVASNETIGTALHAIVALQDRDGMPNALAVIGKEGVYEGLLTARLLAKSLLAMWMPETAVRDDDQRLDTELLTTVQDRLGLQVRAALVRGIPTVSPDSRLLTLIAAGLDKRLEFIPVVENQRVIGLVPVTALFRATAALALTPQDEGIRFDQPRD